MEKYKVCPVCGTHNIPLYLECSECEADLQNVPVVDESVEQVAAQNDNKPVDTNTTTPMVRVCDCGAKIRKKGRAVKPGSRKRLAAVAT